MGAHRLVANNSVRLTRLAGGRVCRAIRPRKGMAVEWTVLCGVLVFRPSTDSICGLLVPNFICSLEVHTLEILHAYWSFARNANMDAINQYISLHIFAIV